MLASFLTRPPDLFGKPVCRLGIASRGTGVLQPDDVLEAIDRGVNFLNWPGASEGEARADAFSRAIASLGPRRDSVVVCTQLAARTAEEAAAGMRQVLAALGTGYIDVVTFYYIESLTQWQSLAAPGGVLDYCQRAKADGMIRCLGLTSHQRPVAAAAAQSGLLDALMIRYNAAHRGAETEIFPLSDALGIPVIAYTALRWGALGRRTPDDPPGFVVPPAADWYRFVLHSPSVAVVLAAPKDREELMTDLTILGDTAPLARERYEILAAHGRRVHAHGGAFP